MTRRQSIKVLVQWFYFWSQTKILFVESKPVEMSNDYDSPNLNLKPTLHNAKRGLPMILQILTLTPTAAAMRDNTTLVRGSMILRYNKY